MKIILYIMILKKMLYISLINVQIYIIKYKKVYKKKTI